jgi:tetratricopeptide (TPR) repeat protein
MRAELHERFADSLEAHGQGLTELDEMLGYHLETAARYRRELDRADPELERRAGRRLAAAGSGAALRSDAHDAANLLRRALALLPRGDRVRSAALFDCITILEELGERELRLRLIEELEQADDATLRMRGRVARSVLRVASEPVEAAGEAEEVADQAIAVFTEAGDDLGAAYAYHLAAVTSWLNSQAVATVRAVDLLIPHARRAGSRLLVGRAMMQLIGPLEYGPFETELIRARLAELPASESPLAKVNVLWVEAELARRDGRYAEALGLMDQASEIERELGLDMATALNTQARAEIMRDQGSLDDAVSTYRQAISRLEELGQNTFRSTTLISLAAVLYDRGQPDEAARMAVEGEQIGAGEDVVNSPTAVPSGHGSLPIKARTATPIRSLAKHSASPTRQTFPACRRPPMKRLLTC